MNCASREEVLKHPEQPLSEVGTDNLYVCCPETPVPVVHWKSRRHLGGDPHLPSDPRPRLRKDRPQPRALPLCLWKKLLTRARMDKVMRSPRLAAMGVAMLSGLSPSFRAPITMQTINIPAGGGDRWPVSGWQGRPGARCTHGAARSRGPSLHWGARLGLCPVSRGLDAVEQPKHPDDSLNRRGDTGRWCPGSQPRELQV